MPNFVGFDSLWRFPCSLRCDSLALAGLIRRLSGEMSAVLLREDFSASDLRLLAKKADGPSQARRLLSLAAVREGMSRAEAAKTGAMDRQMLRDWVHRFNGQGPSGLINAKLPRPKS